MTPASAFAAKESDAHLNERWAELVRNHWGSPARIIRRVEEGLSDSVVCEIELLDRRWCLKGVPDGYSAKRLRWIHDLRRAANAAGLEWVPTPLPPTPTNARGDTFVAACEMKWEISPWLPGKPVDKPSDRQSERAMQALARLHRSWEGIRERGPVEIVRERLAFAKKCLRIAAEHDWERLASEKSQFPWAIDVRRFVAESTTYIGPVIESLSEWVDRPIPRQAVLRDIWSDHLFFRDEMVSGLIDFHAVGVGTVAGDIGRLLASWQLPDDDHSWQKGIEAYESIRPLEAEEATIVRVLDDAARLLTPWVWLTWVFLEGRTFPVVKMNDRVDWSLRRFFGR